MAKNRASLQAINFSFIGNITIFVRKNITNIKDNEKSSRIVKTKLNIYIVSLQLNKIKETGISFNSCKVDAHKEA